MRFKIKPIPKEPEVGDTRTIYKFAWKPTIVCKYKVWLEKYKITEEYTYVKVEHDEVFPKFGWVEIKRDIVCYY